MYRGYYGKKKITARIIAVILCFLLVITLTPDTGRAEDQHNDQASGGMTAEEQSKEDLKLTQDDVDKEDVIESENTKDSTTYSLGGGKRMTIIYGQNVRYEDENGDLKDIDPSLKAIGNKAETENGKSLSGYSYENKAGESHQYIPGNLSDTTPVLLERDDMSMSITPDEDTLDVLGIKEGLRYVRN